MDIWIYPGWLEGLAEAVGAAPSSVESRRTEAETFGAAIFIIFASALWMYELNFMRAAVVSIEPLIFDGFKVMKAIDKQRAMAARNEVDLTDEVVVLLSMDKMVKPPQLQFALQQPLQIDFGVFGEGDKFVRFYLSLSEIAQVESSMIEGS